MFLKNKSVPTAELFTGRRWEKGEVEDTRDAIASEVALALVYNGKPFVVMMVTPQDIEDFALGFSLSEGIIRDRSELTGMRVRPVVDGIEADIQIAEDRFRELERKQRNLTGRIGCGLCGAQTVAQAVRHPRPVLRTVCMSAEAIRRAMAGLCEQQPLNAGTGSVHAAAWATAEGKVMLVREDVGRHNALDKLIGAMVSGNVDTRNGAALITSRASHEMVQKAATVGIQVLCAISAPTALAIRLAKESGVTLIAFARGDRHTVYAHPDRVLHGQEQVAV